MKKKNIWIFIVIVAAACLVFYFWPRQIGYIKIDASGASATLQLRGGLFSKKTVTSGAQSAAVRAQWHHPQQLQLRGTQNGDTWQIDSRGPWGKLNSIKVRKDETTLLKLGPPLLIKPGVSSRGSQVLIDFSITGRAGERYGSVITKNGRRVSTPGVKIMDETGNILAAGKFEYG